MTPVGGSVGALTRMEWSSTGHDRAERDHDVGELSLMLPLPTAKTYVLKMMVTLDPQVPGAASGGQGSSSTPTGLTRLLSVTETVASYQSSVSSSTPQIRASWTCCTLSTGNTLVTYLHQVALLLCDLLDVCNLLLARFPEAFRTFSSFRKFFPAVSSYCFCSNSQGRELHGTGEHRSAET